MAMLPEVQSDYELVNKAAMAIGVELNRDEDGYEFLKYIHDDGCYHYWNSLESANDAMILVIELNINIKFLTGKNRVAATWGDCALYVELPFDEDNKDSRVCRAVTKVAAMMIDENLI